MIRIPGRPRGGRAPWDRDRVIQTALIWAVVLWFVAAVFAPMGQLVVRSLNAEVSVSIFGPEDVRIGGRRIFVEDGQAKIDDQPVAVENGVASANGVRGDLRDRQSFARVVCSRVLLGDEMIDIAPVVVEFGEGSVRIAGEPLGDGEWNRVLARSIGLKRFRDYFSEPNLYRSLANSVGIAIAATAIALVLAFAFAYGITRTAMPGKRFFRTIAMLPLFAPTMLFGLSLVYLFGNKGLVTTGFFEHAPNLAWDIGLYGRRGIIIAETVFVFPSAYLILLVALSQTDARLYEAAASLGASQLRRFLTVTLPNVRYGLVSAGFAGFTLCFTDFGAPKVVGGNYPVLAVDIYKQVVGQQDFGMGATTSLVMLIPAVTAFVADRIMQSRQESTMGARAVPLVPKPNPPIDFALFAVCSLVAMFLLAMLGAAAAGSLVRNWPYNLTLTLKHYTFQDVAGGGYGAFVNSLRVALVTAAVGTATAFVSAYLFHKTKTMPWARKVGAFAALIPLALPGLVIGIAYIFFFNKTHLELPLFGTVPNPLHRLYGTAAILVLANVIHFFTVAYLTSVTALRRLDNDFETVSESMAVPFYATFFRVTVPLSLTALIEIAVYFFVSSMSTVSAVIFLYTADLPLASVGVVNMDDAGDTAAASAMCVLIVLTNVAARIFADLVTRPLRRRTGAWSAR